MQIIGHPVRPLHELILKKRSGIIDLQLQVVVKPAILAPGLHCVVMVKLQLRHPDTRKTLSF